MKTAAILLSRQPLRPSGQSQWILSTRAAIDWIKNHDVELLTSVGMQTWEMITALGSMENVRLCVYVSPGDDGLFSSREGILRQFDLDSDRTRIVNLAAAADERSFPRERDCRIAADADILLPISVRPRGYMASLLESATVDGKEVVSDFVCEYSGRNEPIAYAVVAESVNPDLDLVADNYLIHWTRASNRAWPGELAIDYYRGIFSSERYPRKAYDTLCRIVGTQFLMASGRHMPKKTATVSFSSLSSRDVAPLMRWRSRYSEMSFEPYGIGIRRDAAMRAGVCPVIYLAPGQKRMKGSSDTWLTQSIGTVTDWRQECEWRHRGDLHLARFTRDELLTICRTSDEARDIEGRLGVPALPFCRV